MYLELSDRRTGKTTRLIHRCINFVKEHPNEDAVMIVYRDAQSREFKRHLPPELSNRIQFSTLDSFTTVSKGNNFGMVAIDEFDYLDDDELYWMLKDRPGTVLAAATTINQSKTFLDYVKWCQQGDCQNSFFWWMMDKANYRYTTVKNGILTNQQFPPENASGGILMQGYKFK